MTRLPRILVLLLLVAGLVGSSPGLVIEPGVQPDGDDRTARQAPAPDGCDSPCEGEDDDGACPEGCDDCVCCPAAAPAAAFVVAPPVTAPPALLSHPIPTRAGRPIDRPAPRLYRPPRPPLS